MPGASADVAPSAMITGATGGIGRAIAGRLARAGYRLTLSGRDKAALISLCQSINAEESPAGVTATAIAPGYVDTDMSAWVHDRIDPAEMIPPADIAELILALTRMSARSVIPLVAMSRPGDTQWRA